MTQLEWYPHSPKEWRTRCVGLSLEQRGALKHVLDESWERTPPCTIADTREEFEMLLGHRRRQLEPVIRAHFTPDIEHPGRLRCDWLAELRAAQIAKYLSAAKRGATGGRKTSGDGRIGRRRGQTKLPLESSSASSPATRQASGTAPVAQLAQKLDSSLRTRTGAAVAVAAGAPAAQIEPHDGWSGPDLASLRAWATADPQIADAVSARKVAAMTRDHDVNPRQRLTMEILEGFERDALRAEYDDRHRGSEAAG